MAQYTIVFIVSVCCLLVSATAKPAYPDFISYKDQTPSNALPTTRIENNGENSNDVYFPKKSDELDPLIIAILKAAIEDLPTTQEPIKEEEENISEVQPQGQYVTEEKSIENNSKEQENPSDLSDQSINKDKESEFQPSFIEFIKIYEDDLPEELDTKPQGRAIARQELDEKNSKESVEDEQSNGQLDFMANNGDIINKEITNTEAEKSLEEDNSENESIPEATDQPSFTEEVNDLTKETENLNPTSDQILESQNLEEKNSKETEENKPQDEFKQPDSDSSVEPNPEYGILNNDRITSSIIPSIPEVTKENNEDQKVVIPEAPQLPPLDPSIVEFIKEENTPHGQEILEQKLPEQNINEYIPERDQNHLNSNYLQFVDKPIELIPNMNTGEEIPVFINKPKPSFFSSLMSYLPAFPFSFSYLPSFNWPFKLPSFIRTPSESYPEYYIE